MFRKGELPPYLEQKHDPDEEVSPVVTCSNHMCPIRIHWHVKVNYREYWRVKITATNFNTMKNYTNWNLVVLHPNLKSVQQVFSFNYKSLTPYQNSISESTRKIQTIFSLRLLHHCSIILTCSWSCGFR